MPDYRHLKLMSDEVGLLQFSHLSNPDRLSGYTLDDNARALVVSLYMEDGRKYAMKYASWLYRAQQTDGSWSNFMLNNRYYSRFDSEDSIGRALLACSFGANCAWEEIRTICNKMLENNIYRAFTFRSPRAIAYTLVGICKNQIFHTNEKKMEFISRLSDYLITLYKTRHTKKWLWFEDYFTYCNGILPQAMFAVYTVNNDKKALKIGHDSLGFLNSILFRNAYLNIIGNHGWYQKGRKVPLFDQQPVDAVSTAFACMDAYEAIGGKEYLELAALAYRWYHGLNIHGLSLYDYNTGGCYDALTAEGVNRNQGAEAVLSLLLCELLMERKIEAGKTGMEKSS